MYFNAVLTVINPLEPGLFLRMILALHKNRFENSITRWKFVAYEENCLADLTTDFKVRLGFKGIVSRDGVSTEAFGI
jgi:hypothetical protein